MKAVTMPRSEGSLETTKMVLVNLLCLEVKSLATQEAFTLANINPVFTSLT